jgi:hypothetical protein
MVTCRGGLMERWTNWANTEVKAEAGKVCERIFCRKCKKKKQLER